MSVTKTEDIEPLFLSNTCSIFQNLKKDIDILTNDVYLQTLIVAIDTTDIEPLILYKDFHNDVNSKKKQDDRIEVDIL